MKLSIIIISYNTEKLTLSCLRSLDKYPYSGKFEVIVIDNRSSDSSVEKIKNFTPKEYKLKLIQNENNSGFAKANNQGIRKSSGKYVLLLNSDTEVTKNALNAIVEFAGKHQDAGVVAPKLLNRDKTVQKSVFYLPTIKRAINQYIFGKHNMLDKYAPKVKKPIEVECVVGAAFLITPSARKHVGLLNENYFMYFEDLDYCRAVRKHNLKVYYLPNTKIIHIHGASGNASAEQFKRLVNASKIYHGLIKHYIVQFIIKVGQKIHDKKV